MRRFLVMGCGSIGRRHLQNLLRLQAGDVLAYDVHRKRQKAVEAEFGLPPLADLEEAWQQRPDAALVTSSTRYHVPLALEAARHGCHLFIEKPLSDGLDGLAELFETVASRGLTTLVACNLRFHPGLQIVKTLLDKNAVGRVVAARIEFGSYLPDWHPEEDYRQSYSARRELGGGILLDAIHEIDYAQWLLGEASSVACMAEKVSRLEIDTEDTAALLLRFKSGAIGEIHLDYVQRAYSRTCQIIGEEGTLRWDYAAGEVRWYNATTQAWEIRSHRPWEPNDMYLDEMRHFLRCLDGDEAPAQDLRAGAQRLQVVLEARTSASLGEARAMR